MKKTALIILAFAMIVILASCGGNSALKEAAGTYNGVHGKFVGDTEWVDAAKEPFSLVLKDDGTGTSTRDGADYKVTWTLEGENFTMQETFLGMSIDYTGTLKDGELHVYNGEPTDDLTYEYVYGK